MIRRWAAGALILQSVVLVLVQLGVESPVRAVAALIWALLVPGFAVAMHLRVDPALSVALSVTISMAVGVVVAQSLVWLGWYSIDTAVMVIAGVSSIGLIAGLVLRPGSAPVDRSPEPSRGPT